MFKKNTKEILRGLREPTWTNQPRGEAETRKKIVSEIKKKISDGVSIKDTAWTTKYLKDNFGCSNDILEDLRILCHEAMSYQIGKRNKALQDLIKKLK